ncbi:hypothetical protein D3C72_2465760 [compost metagenome]
MSPTALGWFRQNMRMRRRVGSPSSRKVSANRTSWPVERGPGSDDELDGEAAWDMGRALRCDEYDA